MARDDKRQCDAVIEVTASKGSRWRRGRRCPYDAGEERIVMRTAARAHGRHAEGTERDVTLRLCWLHAQKVKDGGAVRFHWQVEEPPCGNIGP